ncbi:Protein N-terminal amidase [Sphaceloma murrayae]|uniref:Protein N-terminal amidase n=1 Tax=Sphaceloma murrayae TaxID=2082308 RepID=A0A2K1QKX1_9PEZI|nr:Protein N-terminal amidase [Sphaceloma murrayae]
MKIATIQLASKLGERNANITRANELLSSANLSRVDLLVLPEMAFSGYSFTSLAHITPLLEPTSAGPSTQWAQSTARRLQCHVCIGYPETSTAEPGKNYNSLVTVNPAGEVIAHYRKSFLYYTDETWASEGSGFLFTEVEAWGQFSKVAMGICMDINPYRFQTPWEKYEFATHCVEQNASLVVLSTAWLTSLVPEVLSKDPKEPDLDTLNYWVARFKPLLDRMGTEEVVLVFANRCGLEPGTVEGVTRGTNDAGESVIGFAGTSCVVGVREGSLKIWDMLGKAEEAVLMVDTETAPIYQLSIKPTG